MHVVVLKPAMNKNLLLTALLAAACLTACQKKPVESPAVAAVPEVAAAVPAEVAGQPADFVPHIDTFYGPVCEAEYDLPTLANKVTDIRVYAWHKKADTIVFWTDYFTSSISGYEYGLNIAGTYAVNDSNYYTSHAGNEFYDFANCRIKGDSLVYRGSREYCPDIYTYYFAGRRISRQPTTRL